MQIKRSRGKDMKFYKIVSGKGRVPMSEEEIQSVISSPPSISEENVSFENLSKKVDFILSVLSKLGINLER